MNLFEQRQPSFDPHDLIGSPVEEARARLESEGFTTKIMDADGAATLELVTNRYRLAVRGGRVVSIDRG